ncbi:glutathione S-transferase family protein [uncultured Thiothrix sp.]|uniref:glutathione S-transferase family protein n=1 Tax=uncultured Thiothrix sp. TaxID=223185 RepID=UPI00261C28AA|nr:glutathione S-transferase family protein [uncultured Thiothrix sp.]
MSKLVLYTNPQSRGRIAHWMMEELGEPYEIVWLDYATSMQAPEYLAINPMGKVPAITHGTAIVTETAAICAYLADQYPEKQLIPSNIQDRAAYFRWLFFAAGPLEQAVTVKSQNWLVTPEQEVFLGFGNYQKTTHALAIALKASAYIAGEHFSAADVYVGSHLAWGMLFKTIEEKPVFKDYVQRLHARPAYAKALQINEEYLRTQTV